jgi:hypothetical protein
MTPKTLLLAVLLALNGTLAQAEAPINTDVPACTAAGNVTPICGLLAPEDIELLPDGQHLLISQAGRAPDHADGGLFVLNLQTKAVQALPITAGHQPGWGDADCTEPFTQHAGHGLQLTRRKDGRWQLLLVNHQGREAVELFELQRQGDQYQAVWRGCVVNTTDGMYNDVAALPEGGFVATVMFTNDLLKEPAIFKAMASGRYPGHLVEWQADTGLKRLPQSEALFNNGVQVSADGRHVYFAAWVGQQIATYDRSLQHIVSTAAVPFYPDNLSRRADQTFLVTGIDDLRLYEACMGTPRAFCPTAFSVAVFDPATQQMTTLYRGAPGLLSGASVALQLGSKLYVGSYAGDRLLEIDLAK